MATKYVDGVIVALTTTEAESLVMGQPALELTPEERIAAAEAQIQAAIVEIEKAKNDLSDVEVIKSVLGLEENG